MIKDVIKFVLLVALIVVPIRTFIAQPFVVSGASMDNTFNHGDYLIVDQISYRFNQPDRGEVVVFRYPADPAQFFIKRIVGLPGETVELTTNSIIVYNEDHPDGFTLNEPYIYNQDNIHYQATKTKLEANEYFVMGDNRQHSSDSRSWGPLSKDEIIGRPVVRLFPFDLPPAIMPGSFKNQYQF